MSIVNESEDFVEFFSPGTFVSEQTDKPCAHGDITKALEMARGIKERHGASPYGFRFYTIERAMVVDGEGNKAQKSKRETNRSGMHYITGTILRYDDVPDDSEHSILRANMRCNDYAYCIENRNSWRFTGEFAAKDCIVEWDGSISVRGDCPEFMEYRKSFKAMCEEYYSRRNQEAVNR